MVRQSGAPITAREHWRIETPPSIAFKDKVAELRLGRTKDMSAKGPTTISLICNQGMEHTNGKRVESEKAACV